jgi:hypothetical protein
MSRQTQRKPFAAAFNGKTKISNQIIVRESVSSFELTRVDVAVEESQDGSVQESLEALGVALLSEWDSLAFLYHHSASLGTVAQIAQFVGHDKSEIAVALHKLETLGLVRRSRISQGIRMYQFLEPPEPGRHSCLLSLIKLAENRTGRLRLLKQLKVPQREPRRRRSSGLRLA